MGQRGDEIGRKLVRQSPDGVGDWRRSDLSIGRRGGTGCASGRGVVVTAVEAGSTGEGGGAATQGRWRLGRRVAGRDGEGGAETPWIRSWLGTSGARLADLGGGGGCWGPARLNPERRTEAAGGGASAA